MSLIEVFSGLTDFRRGQGKRVDLAQLFSMVTISYLCGYTGYRPVATFCNVHKSTLVSELGLRHGIPSYVTFREIMTKVDDKELIAAFNEWSKDYVPLKKGDWLSGDGKVLGSTVVHADNRKQDFQAVVSMFCHESGLVRIMEQYKNKTKETGEGDVARKLIESLRGMGLIFIFDALHAQKKQ